MSRGNRVFSVEFKQAVVQEMLSGERQVKVARKHGLSVNTVGLWIKSYRTGSFGGEGTGNLQLTVFLGGEYTALLKQHGFQISMSRTGNPYDNGMMERFFRTLKYEEVYLTEYADEREALASIRRFIDQVYNQERLHSRLGNMPPAEFETYYFQTALTP